jgi:hypothetical protein
VGSTSQSGRLRSRRARALAVAVALLGPCLASPARADFDLTNTWIISLRDGDGGLLTECEWDFAQSGTALAVSGPCGPFLFATLVGSVDPPSGAFELEGSAITVFGELTPIEVAGGISADGRTLSGTHGPDPGGIFEGGLCRNRRVDPGESCDEGTSSAGCCTDACDFKPDGVACTNPCQTATSCSSGACAGTPRAAGTSCDLDGNSCTKDSCDAAGSCDAGPCSPCCSGAGCVAALRACRGPVDGASHVLVKSTPTGRAKRLRFTIVRGQATEPADLGDPTATSDYELCAYRIGPREEPVLLFDAAAPAGVSWSRTRNGGAFYRRRDRAPDGVASIRIVPGGEGDAKVRVRGGGPALDVPFPVGPLPAGELTLQLRHAGACWGTTFLLDSEGVNTSELLEAKRSFE